MWWSERNGGSCWVSRVYDIFCLSFRDISAPWRSSDSLAGCEQ